MKKKPSNSSACSYPLHLPPYLAYRLQFTRQYTKNLFSAFLSLCFPHGISDFRSILLFFLWPRKIYRGVIAFSRDVTQQFDRSILYIGNPKPDLTRYAERIHFPAWLRWRDDQTNILSHHQKSRLRCNNNTHRKMLDALYSGVRLWEICTTKDSNAKQLCVTSLLLRVHCITTTRHEIAIQLLVSFCINS